MEQANSGIKGAGRLLHWKAWRAYSVMIFSFGGLLVLGPLIINMGLYFIGLEFSSQLQWIFVYIMVFGAVLFLGGLIPWIISRLAYKKQMQKVIESSKALVVDALVQRLQNKDFGHEQAVITILGELEDKKATLPLIETLKDKNDEVRGKSAWALGKIKDERAGEALWAAAQDEKVDKVKGQAAAALRKLNWQPRGTDLEKAKFFVFTGRFDEAIKLGEVGINTALEKLSGNLESKEKGVRLGSIYLLAKIDDLRVISLLTKATKDADGDVRSAAKLALKKINKK